MNAFIPEHLNKNGNPQKWKSADKYMDAKN